MHALLSIVGDTPARLLFCVCYVLVCIHREQCSVQAAKEAADTKAAADAKVQLRLRARWYIYDLNIAVLCMS